MAFASKVNGPIIMVSSINTILTAVNLQFAKFLKIVK